MPRVVVGLVCEGATDFTIFEHLLKGVAEEIGFSIAFRRFHPTHDATSGRIEAGGWTTVFRWCTRHGPDIRHLIFERGSLFQTDEEPCDYLLVHLDTDICEKIVASGLEVTQHVLSASFDLATSTGRADYVKEIIRFWLRFDETPEPIRSKHIPAPAVECSETWIMAAKPNAGALEDDREIMEKFVASVCRTLNQRPPLHIDAFTKNPRRYTGI